MKKIFIAGSTGSIGKSAIEVAISYPERLSVSALSAGHFTGELKNQIIKLNPLYCILPLKTEMEKAISETAAISCVNTRFLYGDDGLKELLFNEEIDVVLNAISGSSGLMLSYLSVKAGINLALANKESMVMAGGILNRLAKSNNVEIIPVDSEHSALFQCLNCGRRNDLSRLILTASGGPFYNLNENELHSVTRDMALNHPKWKMGKKITIDSSTLANKGLEIIEAHYLFNVDEKDISVLIHPQAIVHSMVEFMDGSVIAQMAQADMKGPIGYALSYPGRFHGLMRPLNLAKINKLEFFEPDTRKFPFLDLARQALRTQKSMPAVFCEANEFFVISFLRNEIPFVDIASNVGRVMEKHMPFEVNDIEAVLEAKKQALALSEAL